MGTGYSKRVQCSVCIRAGGRMSSDTQGQTHSKRFSCMPCALSYPHTPTRLPHPCELPTRPGDAGVGLRWKVAGHAPQFHGVSYQQRENQLYRLPGVLPPSDWKPHLSLLHIPEEEPRLRKPQPCRLSTITGCFSFFFFLKLKQFCLPDTTWFCTHR